MPYTPDDPIQDAAPEPAADYAAKVSGDRAVELGEVTPGSKPLSVPSGPSKDYVAPDSGSDTPALSPAAQQLQSSTKYGPGSSGIE